MKTKKKPTTPKTTLPIKLLNIRTLQPQKITSATNQQTYMTIEQNIRTFENVQTEGKRQSLKARFSFNKKSCNERMEENNLSPFSNDGRSSSPRYRKTPEKLTTARQQKEVKFTINLKELQKKKAPKSKANSARQTPTNNLLKKPIITINKTAVQTNEPKKKILNKKKKTEHPTLKSDKEQKARIEFQNEFLNMMNNRIHKQKITEISEEELEGSIVRRKPKLQICIKSENGSREENRKEKEKRDIVKTMKLKVMKNIQRDYPNLDSNEKKVICAVMIIQRLWRQRKVKQFFQHYVTPKASPQTSFRSSLQKQTSSNNNSSTINLLNNHMGKKSSEYNSCDAVPRKTSTRQKKPITMQNNFLIRQKSEESCQESAKNNNGSQHLNSASTPKQSKLNDKVNRLFQDSILSFQNENEKIIKQASGLDRPSMMKFVECYRQVKLTSHHQHPTNKNPSTTKSKRNIFSLKASLSQKCLMQKYYTRIFSDRPQKDKPKNYELFSFGGGGNHSSLGNESLKQNQKSSIELFREINSHKAEEEEVWVRSDTSYGVETDSEELVAGKEKKNGEGVGLVDRIDEKKVAVDQICCADGFQKKTQRGETLMQQTKAELLEPITLQEEEHPSCGIVINQRESSQKPTPITLPLAITLPLPVPQQPSPQFSLKSINTVSSTIITQLMNEFFTQYLSFQQKKCLTKKHRSSRSKQQQQKDSKPRLPGIEITPTSITQYLDILIPYILDQDRPEVLRSLQLFHPSTYQKCHRVESPVYEVFDFAADQEEEDEIYWNIISNEGFFVCLERFWQENVKLTRENEKFMNFLDLTYKVYNRCVTDAFSQIFNKLVLERVFYPWNRAASSGSQRHIIKFSKHAKTLLNPTLIETIATQVKQKLLAQSFCYSTTAGKLTKKDRKPNPKPSNNDFEFGHHLSPPNDDDQILLQKLSDNQLNKIMKIANDEFLEDEKELMLCVDERYEIGGDLGEVIFADLLKQVENELLGLEESRTFGSLEEIAPFTKSQTEVFLETNQTLETNCHC